MFTQVPVFSREELQVSTCGEGPCIIEDYDFTLVVNSEWKWKVNDYGIDLKR